MRSFVLYKTVSYHIVVAPPLVGFYKVSQLLCLKKERGFRNKSSVRMLGNTSPSGDVIPLRRLAICISSFSLACGFHSTMTNGGTAALCC